MGAGCMNLLKKTFYAFVHLIMKTTGFSERFVLFLFMGGINTLFYYALYSILIYTGFHYAAAVGIATVCGVLFNFQTFGRVVFKDFHLALLWRFVCVYVVVYIVNVVGLKLLELVGLTDKYIAGGVLVLPMALLGYFLNKTFVFNRSKSRRENPLEHKTSRGS